MAVHGLVVPGGESTTMGTLAAAFDLLEPLRKRVADGLPVFGTCAGMIMLADRVLDGVEGQETIGGIGAAYLTQVTLYTLFLVLGLLGLAVALFQTRNAA